MSSDLKPCPFCGGDAEEFFNFGGLSRHNKKIYYLYIECKDCGAKTRSKRCEQNDIPDIDQFRILRGDWNRRAET